ncbi:MAG: hypothetical protein V3W31_04430, partial [Thermodesulfobacteriota bacterium]
STIASLETGTDYVYNLCFKCHSYWAANTTQGSINGIGITSPSTVSPKAWTNADIPANEPMTDVATEFATGNLGYHPLYAKGLNQPDVAGVRNPNWCSGGGTTYGAACTATTGTRWDLRNDATYVDTLSQNFVPPWRHDSFVTCVDCHEDNSETTPRGPHGSSRPFILRQVDGSISYAICSNATCTTSTTVSYATLGASATDNTMFCLNCHRADVYGLGSGGSGGGHWGMTGRRTLARVPHPMIDDPTDAGTVNSDQSGNLPRGIACMRCHGGGGGGVPPNCGNSAPTSANSKLGNIHGHDCDSEGDGDQNRLIALRGAWSGWNRPNAGNQVDCTRGGNTDAGYNEWGGCSNDGSDGNGGYNATYTYP